MQTVLGFTAYSAYIISCLPERDDLYLRNADLSSKLEKCKMELKSVLSSHESDKATFQRTLESNGKCLLESSFVILKLIYL